MVRVGRFWDGEDRLPAQEESERHLARRGVVGFGDLPQQSASGGSRVGKPAMAEGAVRHQGGTVALTPWQNGVLDSALLEMIQDLVAHRAFPTRHGFELYQIGHVEIGSRPKPGFSRLV